MAARMLTACLIVKDEATFLPRCLESLVKLRPTLREICVYDTGSTDGTPELARRAGCRVVQGHWDDDFARARNAAVDLARTDWVLSIDADERVHSDSVRMARLLDYAHRKGLESLVLKLDDIRGGVCVGSCPSVRMHRPEVAHFRNRIHEIVVRKDGMGLRGARVQSDVAFISHHGYGQADAMVRRRERNSRIGDLEVDELVGQHAGADRLVEALVNRGRSRAVGRDAVAGIPDWEVARRLDTDSPFRTWAGELLASAYIERGDITTTAVLLAELSAEGSHEDEVAWLTGRAFLAAGRPWEALACLRSVDRPVTALGWTTSPAPVLQARMLAAAEVGEVDEALAAALPLFARHGVIHGFGRLLLLCWGDRSLEELAVRLVDESTDHLDALGAEFSQLGERGRELAAALTRCATT